MARNGYKLLDSDMHVYVRGYFELYNNGKNPPASSFLKGDKRRHGLNGLNAPQGSSLTLNFEPRLTTAISRRRC
jgi:hypothetical protein